MNGVFEDISWPFVVRQSLAVKCLFTFFAVAAIVACYDEAARWPTMVIAGMLVLASINAFLYRVEITSQLISKRSLLGIRTVPLSHIDGLKASTLPNPTLLGAKIDGVALTFQLSPPGRRWYSKNLSLLLDVSLTRFDWKQGRQVIRWLAQRFPADDSSHSQIRYCLDLLTDLIESRHSWKTRLAYWGKAFLLGIGFFTAIWLAGSLGLFK